MSSHASTVTGSFRVGYRPQTVWGVTIATAFFFGEMGAGLFLVSTLFGLTSGMVLGLLLTAVGKTTGHLLHLGQPARAWRAIAGVRRSWVSRGLLAIVLFTGFGFVATLGSVGVLALSPVLLKLATAVALAAALVVMTYQGFAMSHSPSITLWSTGLMPIASLTYALLAGVSLTLVLGWGSLAPESLRFLKGGQLALLLYGLIVVFSLLHGARYGSEAGRESVERLMRRDLSKYFLSLVVFVGFVFSMLVLYLGPDQFVIALAAALAELTGYYAFRVLVLKAGTYQPLMSFKPHGRR